MQAIAPRDVTVGRPHHLRSRQQCASTPRGRPAYRERFIHGQIYKVRPDVNAVVHSHSPTVIPVQRDREAAARDLPQRPFPRSGHAGLGNPRSRRRAEQHAGAQQRARPIARQALGKGSVVLMRGHGNAVAGPDLKTAVFRAIYTEVNAKLQMQAVMLGGPINFLNEYEQQKAQNVDRPWDTWRNRWARVKEQRHETLRACAAISRCSSRACRHRQRKGRSGRRLLSRQDRAGGHRLRAGGNYDLYGRLAAEFLGRHIPGQSDHRPGEHAGSRRLQGGRLPLQGGAAGRHLPRRRRPAARDERSLVDDKMGIDPTRFNYLGRLVSMVDVAVALPKSGINSFEDTRKREVTVGAGQATSTSAIYARALNAYAGSRFKIVTGYSGTAEIQLAAERGEVDVNGGKSLPAIHRPVSRNGCEGKAVLLYQNGLKRYSSCRRHRP